MKKSNINLFVIIMLFSIIVSSVGLIYSFIKPEEANAMALPIFLPGKQTTIFDMPTCKCLDKNEFSCICWF
ncbi:hypothetical protein J7K93_03520 [bacterium]|nr:hypothetical protein [bacterium]